MRDFLSNLFARLRGSSRQEKLYAAAGAVAVAVLLRYGFGWLVDYRNGVKDDIQLTADRLANAQRMLTRAPEVEKQLVALKTRYGDTVGHLVPGDTPTLAAAALQERVSTIAAEKSVAVQTTQVMKDEAVGTFRKVSLRITANGDLRQLADFLAELEFGSLRVSVPFIELTRRSAARRDNAPRTVSATIEIAGIVQGTAVPVATGAAATAAAVAAPAGVEAPAPGEALSSEPSLAGAAMGGEPPEEEHAAIPDDPLGTGQLKAQPE